MSEMEHKHLHSGYEISIFISLLISLFYFRHRLSLMKSR